MDSYADPDAKPDLDLVEIRILMQGLIMDQDPTCNNFGSDRIQNSGRKHDRQSSGSETF
jgi:hypothetical protein